MNKNRASSRLGAGFALALLILLSACASKTPAPVVERKDKMGFPTPLAQWTKGAAREFVRDILLSDRVRQRGIYNVAAIEREVADEVAEAKKA